MGYWADKEEQELNRLYPEGTVERKVLDYSRKRHGHGTVPPMLLMAFKLLMGISIFTAVISLVTLLNEL